MPYFSQRSVDILMSCDFRIIGIMREVIKYEDFSVVSGRRGFEEQERLYNEGKSQLQYPDSKHNSYPSEAIDIAPYPIDWEDASSFHMLAGAVMYEAKRQGIDLVWGGDWDSDGSSEDTKFMDLGHFELK